MSFNELAQLVTVRPLSAWPGPRTPETFRDVSRFTASWSDTVEVLVRELSHLQADDVVLEVDVREQDLRKDGLPRSTARIVDPGVIVSFGSVHGPLRYACDTYERPTWGAGGRLQSWQHNLRAIAKGLEALRAVDRYGVTSRGEQYAGWKALPAPMAMDGPSHMTHTEAQTLLEELSELSWGTDPKTRKQVIRRARAAVHPDRHAGDTALWDQVEAAVAVVDR